jgi:hypothetical protein
MGDQCLEKSLSSYSGHVDFFDPEGGDTFLMLNKREWLEQPLEQLSPRQQDKLNRPDRQALILLHRYQKTDSLDLEFLRAACAVIEHSRLHSELAV